MAGKDEQGEYGNTLSLGSYELILDILDIIPPSEAGDAVKTLTVDLNGRKICCYEFDTLPYADFMRGADDVYKIPPILKPDGTCVSCQDRIDKPRRFLYRCSLEFGDITFSSGELTIVVVDFAGNTVKEKFILSFS